MRRATNRAGARVLLAEDNAVNQEVAIALLQDVGASVEVASNGAEAVAAAARQPFDVVLMDMQMPGMDGLEAARQIRGLPEGRHLPIIAMTANAMEGNRMASPKREFMVTCRQPSPTPAYREKLVDKAPPGPIRPTTHSPVSSARSYPALGPRWRG